MQRSDETAHIGETVRIGETCIRETRIGETARIRETVLIGLTGTYCAGKNYIARFLEARGLPTLDVDALGHQALEMEKSAVLARFGSSVLGKDGAIDRRALGAKAFGDKAALAALEGIVHPAVNRLTDSWIAGRQGMPCVVNAALLHKSSAFHRFSFIILVKAPLIVRLLRAKRRDKLPWIQIVKRFISQKNFTPQYFQKNADIVIVHNGGFFDLWTRLFRGSPEKQIDVILSLKLLQKT
ncbi:MAG: dephospho-CoA kinase [Spirochaetaceae bacterium]|jgi:dephospho-CoA kinase|nr:dephospho-CoA kinase [Spirochaetaceae bacterium]